MTKRYDHIFFDLDHTLWDFDSNSRETLLEIFHEFELKTRGFAHFNHFIDTYEHINDRFWSQYRKGKVTKEELRIGRFLETLSTAGKADEALAFDMSFYYLEKSPTKPHLLPGAIKVLDHLKGKCGLHLITNGFKEVQYIKLQHCGLAPYFDNVIISEEVGFQKPHEGIFKLALERANTTADKAVMIGDSFEADILGAHRAGMDTIFFSPERVSTDVPDRQIASLLELMEMF